MAEKHEELSSLQGLVEELGWLQAGLGKMCFFGFFFQGCIGLTWRPCTSEGLPHFSHLSSTRYTNIALSVWAFWFKRLSQGYPRAESQLSPGTI